MEKLLEFLIKKATGLKDVGIEKEAENDRENLIIKVPQDSIGLIVGKKGRIIKALRSILIIKATLEKRKIGVSVAPLE